MIFIKSEKMGKLNELQQKVLKEEIRKMERDKKREGADLVYLKNIVIKYMTSNEHEALLPVISTLLQFSPEELQKIKQVRSQPPASIWNKWVFPSKS